MPVGADTPPIDNSAKVTVVSSRPAIVAAWLARLANEPRLRVAGATAYDERTLRAALIDSTPRVLLLDVASLEWLDAKALPGLRAQHGDVRVLLTCDAAGPQLVELVLSHRFHGYLVSGERTDICVKAVLAVCRGELWLPRASLAEALYRAYAYQPWAVESPVAEPKPKIVRAASLTERERQVADCLRYGSSNSEIALELGIKKDTVKKHVRRVFGKLGVQRRSDVAALHRIDEPVSSV